MLSALIWSAHSYPAMLLVEQLVHQRCVHPGPLVLGANPLKFPIVHSGYKPNCLTRVFLSCSILKTYFTITDGTDYIFTLLLCMQRGADVLQGLVQFVALSLFSCQLNFSLYGDIYVIIKERDAKALIQTTFLLSQPLMAELLSQQDYDSQALSSSYKNVFPRYCPLNRSNLGRVSPILVRIDTIGAMYTRIFTTFQQQNAMLFTF